MLSILNFLTSVKNITANDIPLFQYFDAFDYSKEKFEGTRIDFSYFRIIIDGSPYELGNRPFLLRDIKILMWFVSKTDDPEPIGTIPLENNFYCFDEEELGKYVKKIIFYPKDKESYKQLNSTLESASTLGEETYIFFQIYGFCRKINETSAPTVFNSEEAYRIFEETFQKLDPRVEGFKIPSASDTLQLVEEGVFKTPEDEILSPKNNAVTAINSERAYRISEEVSREPEPRVEGFKIPSVCDTLQTVEEGALKTPEDETTSPKNNSVTTINFERAYRISEEVSREPEPRVEGFKVPSACDTLQTVEEGSLKPTEDETTSPKNNSHTAIHSESASRISEEVSQEPEPRVEGFKIPSACDTLQAVEKGASKPPKDETESPKNNAEKPDPEKTFWAKYSLYIYIGGSLLLISPIIYVGYKVTGRD